MSDLAVYSDQGKLPETYEQAKTALSECDRVDECKSWSDKAAALASYAKQAQDETLEHYAMRIKARAIRRAGRLLEQIEPSKGGQPTHDGNGSSRRKVAIDAGMSQRQQNTAQRVARIPDDDFEQQIESESPPTITELANQGTRKRDPNKVNHSLKAWATLKEFSTWCNENTAADVADGFLNTEIPPAIAQAESIMEWLGHLIEELRDVYDQDAQA